MSERSRSKGKNYPKKRLELLSVIGFVFDLRKDYFNQKIKDLKEFKLKYGHTNPPQSNEALGNWVNRLRNDYKKINYCNLKLIF